VGAAVKMITGIGIKSLLTFALKLEQVQVLLIKRVKSFYLFRIHGILLSLRVPGIGYAEKEFTPFLTFRPRSGFVQHPI
jgi:hypothetical protein